MTDPRYVSDEEFARWEQENRRGCELEARQREARRRRVVRQAEVELTVMQERDILRGRVVELERELARVRLVADQAIRAYALVVEG